MNETAAFGYSPAAAAIKRLAESAAAFLAIAATLPLFALLCLLLRVVQGAPVFFRQNRVGRSGREFRLLKLRTMEKAPGDLITARDDPRITPLGRRLRSTRLDEWPQLLQVISGSMALVGPRPEIPEMVALWDERQRRLLELRPGLTDPSTLESLDEEDILAREEDRELAYRERLMPAKIARSLEYFQSPALIADLVCLLKTAARLCGGRRR